MTITVDFWHLVGMLLAFLSTCFGFAKLMFVQFHASMDERYINQKKVNEKVEVLEQNINNIKATLPLTYVLREDYVRGQVVLESKMDALHKTLTDMYKKEVFK